MLGYGAQNINQPNRFYLGLNSSFTLGQLWQQVADNSHEALHGGKTLGDFNKDFDQLFNDRSDSTSKTVQELKLVFETDVARQLISQDIGKLTRDIQDLRKGFLENTHVSGMVGFTSRAVSNDSAERALAGGYSAGSMTKTQMTATQKALIESKAASLFREGLRLQDRLLNTTRLWQEAVAGLAQAQWGLKMARFEFQNAPSEAMRREANVRVVAAENAVQQARLQYTSLTGREWSAELPLEDLSVADLQALTKSLRAQITAPDRFAQLLRRLDPAELAQKLGDNPLNLVDWLPWVDRFSAGVGVQYQDILASQALTLNMSVRLPIYDPTSKAADISYVLEQSATIAEMGEIYAQHQLKSTSDATRAKVWAQAATELSARMPEMERRVVQSARSYRNAKS
jgi:hypothetical protein